MCIRCDALQGLCSYHTECCNLCLHAASSSAMPLVTHVSSLRMAKSFSQLLPSDCDLASLPQPPKSNRAFERCGWHVQPCAVRCNNLVSPLHSKQVCSVTELQEQLRPCFGLDPLSLCSGAKKCAWACLMLTVRHFSVVVSRTYTCEDVCLLSEPPTTHISAPMRVAE